MSGKDEVNGATQTLAEELSLLSSDLNDARESLVMLLDARDATINDLTNRIQGLNTTMAAMQSTITDLKAKLASVTPSAPVVTPPAPVVRPASVTPAAGFTLVPQNMTEVSSGVWRSTNLGATKAAGGQVAVVQARLATPAQPGQTVVVKYDQTTNVVKDGTKNLKDFRSWPSPSYPYPNDYTGRTLGAGDDSITAENNDGVVLYHGSSPAKWNVAYFHMPIKADVKQHIERTIRFSSAPGKPDGYAKIVVDNLLVFEADGFVANGPREDFGPQMVYAPLAGDSGPLPAGSYLQIENLSVAVL